MAQDEIGDHVASQATLCSSLTLAEERGEPFLVGTAKLYLASLLSDQPAANNLDQAQRLASAMLGLSLGPNYLGFAHSILSRSLHNQGDLTQAEEHARKAIDMLAMMRPYRIAAFVNLSRTLLAQGRISEARAAAEQGLQLVNELQGSGYNEVSLRLAVAEARHAAGNQTAAFEALRQALAALRYRAGRTADSALRQRFLTQIRDNARTIELAAAWLGHSEQGVP